MSEKNNGNISQITISEKRVDKVSSILWISLGIFVIFQSRQLNYTDDFGPAAGFVPFWLGIILVILGIILAIQTFDSRKEDQEISIASKSDALKMFIIISGLFVFIVLIERAGFYLSAGLLFLFLLYVAEKQSLKYSLIAAILSFFMLWLIFGLGLKLQLPMGFMEFMRFI